MKFSLKKNKKRWIKGGCALLLSLTIIVTLMPASHASAYNGSYYGTVSTGCGRYFNFNSGWGFDVYAFCPSVTGNYRFYSYSRSQGDPYFYLVSPSYYSTVYNSIANNGCKNSTAASYCLSYNDDSNGDANFALDYTCYAGQTYYCFVTKYSTNSTVAYFNITGPSYYGVNFSKCGGSGGSNYYYDYGGAAWPYTNSSYAVDYITPPSRTGYTFTGYFNATSGGTQYVASNGYLYSNARSYTGTYLYAQWAQNSHTITYNNQGVSNTSSILGYGSSGPSSVSVPQRTGYVFGGYYNSVSGGTQYYNSAGSRVTSWTVTGNRTFYARWTPAQYTIEYGGMSGANYGTKHPTTHTYGTASAISDPSKDEYTFMGWTINGGSALNTGLTLSSTGYTGKITLTANWKKTTEVSIEDQEDLKANTTTNQEDLNRVFTNPVEDALKGVTTDELSNNASVALKLKVTSSTQDNSEAQSAILEKSKGEVVKFFDASIVKEVTSLSNQTTTTTLKEIPVTVAVTIPLSEDLAGKTSYSVYRYHTYSEKKDGQTINNSELQQIGNDSNNSEYYEVTNDSIVIYTKMFSTFAIAAGEDTLDPVPAYDGGSGKSSTDIDVQGKVSQTGLAPVYKMDVSWGSMAFTFTTASVWDPYNHEYGDASYAWSSDSFNGKNNKISVTNHSNADVDTSVNFVREDSQLVNTDVTFRETNAINGAQVDKLYMPKVVQEGADPTTTDMFVWLNGTPTSMPGAANADTYTKVGVITLTFDGQGDLGLTPKTAE